jgi:hypothetical protein
MAAAVSAGSQLVAAAVSARNSLSRELGRAPRMAGVARGDHTTELRRLGSIEKTSESKVLSR